MKKSERRMILILIIVAIIIIAVLVKVRSGNDSGESKKSNATKQGNGTSSVEGENQNNTPKEDFVEVLEDGTRLNISNKLSETKTFGNYEISNIQLTESNGLSTILADAKNIGSTNAETTFIQIVVLDEDGNEITSMNSMIGEVAAGETVQLNASATVDFANAYDFKINFQ